ncbi:hypothetical protein DOS84_02410 [Flavobacterium aquariorum]|uniref:Uncharacterized protein n=1 Tax=Flavobacterium aquariorum TaxID=2217670 RepID=A0A2W7TZH6_9FLAO|nr:hypothetical protein [Flavobacterium aquariorum]PZX95438.1 hypothetical protein DOS84_02410 [Flavobacterium aquariorum]
MQKNTILISGLLLLFLGVVVIPFSLQAKGKTFYISTVFKHPQKNPYSNIQDKNLIKGNWQRDDTAVELHILRLLENGSLQVNYLNSKFIYIEKAGWTNSSDVLRLFVIYRQDDNPGYSLSLQYLAEKDILVGDYVDGSDNKSHNVIFKRIK